MSSLHLTAAIFLEGNGLQPACHAYPGARVLRDFEWLGEPGPILEPLGRSG